MNLFCRVYSGHQFFSTVVYTLPMHDVNAIGKKLPVLLESSVAELLQISQTTPCFQVEDTSPDSQQVLQSSRRAGISEGHLLRI